MNPLTDIGAIRALLDRHSFRFSKVMGQNFIVNPTVCPRIAEMGGASPGVGALEIGPGIGVLTAELARRSKKVVAIELDDRLPPILAETLAEFSNVEIVPGDVLKLDLQALLAEKFAGMEVVVCANLPYYITSPVIMRLLEERLPVRSLTVMVQKEAAQRLCAAMPSRQAGAVTAAVAYYAKPATLFGVSRGSFLPSPAVDSAVIKLEVRETPAVAVADEALLFRLIRAAFGQRRKTLLNSLSAGMGLDKAAIADRLTRAGVNPGKRAEELFLEEFAGIANAW
jgi:16S rRNA (adenine1518-N6/adenine1519-N6)-dimethyltransferase